MLLFLVRRADDRLALALVFIVTSGACAARPASRRCDYATGFGRTAEQIASEHGTAWASISPSAGNTRGG
jgi:hypothetical protein